MNRLSKSVIAAGSMLTALPTLDGWLDELVIEVQDQADAAGASARGKSSDAFAGPGEAFALIENSMMNGGDQSNLIDLTEDDIPCFVGSLNAADASMLPQSDETELIPALQNFGIDNDDEEELDDATLIACAQAAEQAIAARPSLPSDWFSVQWA